jgi:hypothetical protein
LTKLDPFDMLVRGVGNNLANQVVSHKSWHFLKNSMPYLLSDEEIVVLVCYLKIQQADAPLYPLVQCLEAHRPEFHYYVNNKLLSDGQSNGQLDGTSMFDRWSEPD